MRNNNNTIIENEIKFDDYLFILHFNLDYRYSRGPRIKAITV